MVLRSRTFCVVPENKNIYEKIKSTRRENIVQLAISEGLFEIKQYMLDSNIYESEILIRLIYNYEKIHEEFNLNLNRIITAITFLKLFKRNNTTFIRVPDKKLTAILKTNKRICHKFLHFLSGILSENTYQYVDNYSINNFEFNFDYKNEYYIYNLTIEDQFIIDIELYLYKKQLSRLNFSEAKIRRLCKKHKRRPLEKLAKRKELYFYNTTCCNIEARNNFKKIAFGLSWWNTELTEKYYTSEALKRVREASGLRQDIFYMEVPLDAITYATGLDGIKISSRINTTISGMGTLIQKHDSSYLNIEDKKELWSPVKKDIYENFKLLHHGTVLQESKNNEQYMASIQGFQTTSNSYIVDPEYFNTYIGRFILENKDIYLYILKDYYTNYYTTNEDRYLKRAKNKKLYCNEPRELLTQEQLTEILNSDLLKDIDLNDKELKRKVSKFLNKDKILALPLIKSKNERMYNYKSCMKKDKYKKIITKNQTTRDLYTNEIFTESIIQFKDPLYCIKYIPKVISKINTCSDENVTVNLPEYVTIDSDETNNKNKDNESLPNRLDSIIIETNTKYKKEYDELKYWLSQLKLITEHVLKGFSKIGKELEKFLLEIRRNKLGAYFKNYLDPNYKIAELM